MFITMAGETFLCQPQKCFCRPYRRIANEFFLDEIGLMAIATCRLGMPAFQHVSGFVVIKMGFAGLPKNQPKISSVMLAMAGGA